jgi:hypothetical protein
MDFVLPNSKSSPLHTGGLPEAGDTLLELRVISVDLEQGKSPRHTALHREQDNHYPHTETYIFLNE